MTREGTITLWKSDGTAGPVITLSSNRYGLRALVWSPDGQLLAGAINHGETCVQLWNADGSDGPVLQGKVESRCVAWSPDSQQLVVGDASGNLQIWSRSGEPDKLLSGHRGEALAVAWSKKNQILSSASDRMIRCWDGSTGQPRWISIAQETDHSATFTVDGKPLSSTSDAEQTFAYFVEREFGRVEVLRPSEYRALR
jgi:WD40 repeat protein